MAYILMSGRDIRKLAVDVNAKQNQGFIPAGGISYKDGTFYQFMAPTDIPDPALYGIVMTQSDLDFAARAALMPGAPLGTMIQHKAYFIQAFGTAVSDSGMIQIPLAVANGGTGATSIALARQNLRVYQESTDVLGTNLNLLRGGSSGFYTQPNAANATLANNYPVTSAGSLMIIRNVVSGDACRQIYYVANSNDFYTRVYSGSTWSTWLKFSQGIAVTNATSAASTIPGALAAEATLADVITTVNALITALTAVRSNSGSSVTQLNALLTSLRAAGTVAT